MVMIWANDRYTVATPTGVRRGIFWTFTDEGDCACEVCARKNPRMFAFEDTEDDYGASFMVCIDCISKMEAD